MQVPQPKKLARRGFVGLMAAGLAGCGRRSSDWRFFKAEEARTVDAICAQLIPRDRDPGAREARVVRYIDLQLTGHFRKQQRLYREGVAAVDALSRDRFGNLFVDLPVERQIEILRETEKRSRPFFETILNHTRQGFYGDPRHGGNYDRVSWKMLGLPHPPLRGRIVARGIQ